MPQALGEKERIAIRQRYVMERRAQDSMSLDEITDAWNKHCEEEGRPEDKRQRVTISYDLRNGLKLLHDETKIDASHYRDMIAQRIEYALSRPRFKTAIENGDVQAVDRLLKATSQLAALYGANMPTKIANTDAAGNDIVNLSEEERAERVRQMLERAATRRAESGDNETPEGEA